MMFKFTFLFVVSSFGIERSLGSVASDAGFGRSFFCANNDNPCLNNGNCMDAKSFPRLGNSYECECVDGCTGFHCEDCPSSDDVCNPNPCRGDCNCNPSCKHELGYYCRSYSGYLGKNCTIPPPVLDCYSDRMTVTVPEEFVSEYDNGLRNSFLVVQPGLSGMTSCQYRSASNGRYEITIPMPFNSCGTNSEQLSNGNVIFKNQVWFNRNLKNSAFDMPIPAIAFECTYAREYQVMTVINPIVPLPPTIRDEVRVLPSISLCKSRACPGTCPENLRVTQGAIYTVGEHIHVTMNLDTGNLVTTIAEMSISCSSSVHDTTNSVEIVTNGCGTSSGLPCRVTHNGESHTVCITFQTPRGLVCSEIYIHARLASCPQEIIQNCAGGEQYGTRCQSARRRRSAETFENVIGPFYIISGSKGVPTMRVFPENEVVSADAEIFATKDVNMDVQELVDEVFMTELDTPLVATMNVAPAWPSGKYEAFPSYYFVIAALACVFVAFFAMVGFMCMKKSKSGVLLNDSI